MRAPTLSYYPVLAHVVGVTITAVNLAANLAGRESGRVHVDIGRVIFEGVLYGIEITSHHVLSSDGLHVRTGDGARHRTTARRAGLNTGRWCHRGPTAEPHHDAAAHVHRAEMDVRHERTWREIRVGEPEGERLRLSIKFQLQRARTFGQNGPRARDFLKT